MRRFRGKRNQQDPVLELTPMIDVVFQLIIFFIVTINLNEQMNPDIELPMSPSSYEIDSLPNAMVIEVSQRGWISMHGTALSPNQLQNMLAARSARIGEFPVLIRGDGRAEHKHVRAVMDMCAAAGLWRINFVAIQEKKGG